MSERKTLTMYERCGLRFRWGKTSKSSISEKKRLQWYSMYDKWKHRDAEDRVKEIDPPLRTDTLYISIIQRETALGLTRVVISRLQQGSDSNMTRMNELASCPNQDTCCWRNDTFISNDQSLQFFHTYIYFLFLARCHAIKNIFMPSITLTDHTLFCGCGLYKAEQVKINDTGTQKQLWQSVSTAQEDIIGM